MFKMVLLGTDDPRAKRRAPPTTDLTRGLGGVKVLRNRRSSRL